MAKAKAKTAKTTEAKPKAAKKSAATTVAVSGNGGHRWLVKSEPNVYGIVDLERDGATTWEGVRNYTARNTMRDGMKLDDLVLFYHSNAEPSGIAGVARVSGLAEPDPSQFDRKSEYYDAGAQKNEPRWLMVRLAFVERFDSVLSLEQLKTDGALVGMPLLQRGQRLSVQPVDAAHFAHALRLAKAKTKA